MNEEKVEVNALNNSQSTLDKQINVQRQELELKREKNKNKKNLNWDKKRWKQR